MKRSQRPDVVHYADFREIVFHAAEQFPDTEFFPSSDTEMPTVTGRALKQFGGSLGAWVRREGLQGAHIALLGPNGAAWISAFFAILSGGCVAVPLHLGTNPEELASCLERSDCVLLLYDKRCGDAADQIFQILPALRSIELHTFLSMLSEKMEQFFPPLVPDDPAALYFTSGTTARSRCVILTHRNMGSHASAAMSQLPLSPKDAGLSVLPPSHTFEMMTNIIGSLHCGGTVYINEDLTTVKENLKRYAPSILVVVPLVLQVLYKEIRRTAKRRGKLDQLERGLKLNGFLRRFGVDLSRWLFRDVYSVVGSNLRYFLCGGAALDPELIAFFRCLGITVLQGYGITECSPIVAANVPFANRFGSIGKPFPCCEVRLIGGEICVRGDSVSPGYYRDEEANREAYQGGWFHTGDLGRMDRDGYLYFTGRKKNLIVLSNGENVSPERLEEQLYRIEGVEDAVVYDSRGKITAEVYADSSAFPDEASLWRQIDRVNLSLAPHEQIGSVVLRREPFEKTVTQIIKRYA